jgi:hypothetical protein
MSLSQWLAYSSAILSSALFVNTHVSNQVSSSSRESPVQADVVEYFLQVGDCCIKFQNF